MKQLQQHYTKELSDALDKLEQNYHSKRNEAFEKLVPTIVHRYHHTNSYTTGILILIHRRESLKCTSQKLVGYHRKN